MKDGRTISSGIRVKKRQNYDELIQNFRKKLIIEDDITEIKTISIKHTSTALVLYKNPVALLTPKNISKDLLEIMDKQMVSPSDSILISSNYLKMEHLFNSDIEGKEIKPDDNGSSDMILD